MFTPLRLLMYRACPIHAAAEMMVPVFPGCQMAAGNPRPDALG